MLSCGFFTLRYGAHQAITVGALLMLPSWGSSTSVNLMTSDKLGDFEDDGWEGYACTFKEWTACVNSTTTADCSHPSSPCRKCTSKRSGQGEAIKCEKVDGQIQFLFPAGGIFPVAEQFTIPANTAIVGAANPNNPLDKTQQQTNISSQTWFVVPRSNALCRNPWCIGAKGFGACLGDPKTHRQGFLMSSNSMLKNVNFQGADLGRAGIEAWYDHNECGPGAIELPGCLNAVACSSWGAGQTTGGEVVHDVIIQHVRLSDAVMRADITQMQGNCKTGEALDSEGRHVRAHQIAFWVAKLPTSENRSHSNVIIDDLVSMNSRSDGLNVHGAVRGLNLQNSHIENSGDDCIGIWSTGIENMAIRNLTAKNCAVTAGAQGNWGSCVGTYAFTSLVVDGLTCYDPFETIPQSGCPQRTHFTAIHINKAFASDCMPMGASLSLSGIEYFASAKADTPLDRPKCGQCTSCCGACSTAGFDNLTIKYLDGSVPEGSCMQVSAGCDGLIRPLGRSGEAGNFTVLPALV